MNYERSRRVLKSYAFKTHEGSVVSLKNFYQCMMGSKSNEIKVLRKQLMWEVGSKNLKIMVHEGGLVD